MIEYIEISGIKTIVRLPDNYLCGRKYKVIFINDGEIVNNIEQPDNQIYVGLIPKNRLAAYTPWPYKAIREGAEDFGGECREYHNQLVGEIVPYISKHYNVYAESMAYGGYSLGGLAAIYSLYFDETFSTIFSVCGSFWYPGFADYVVNNNVKNYAGSRGAQLASYLINDCFGISSFFILVFLAVAGLKLMRVRIVRLWKWFIGCTLLLVWFSVFFGFALMDHYQDSFIYLGGMHGYNVSRWLVSQVGVPGVWMILLITAVCFFIYISARTVIWLRKLFALSFLKRQKKEEEKETAAEGTQEFTTSQPQEVEFNLKRTYKQTPPPAPVMDIQAEEPKEESPVNAPEPDDELPSADEAEGVTMVFEPTVSDVVPPIAQDELP